ncbi:helix-turn-helix domain-containing protein [Meiothermus granaticius]|uniref:helix-turn-helix domain-containing protein n=1 Tax=Meiothermus granaticius TaxID=863370 RepID=UPI0014727209|nr:helix-turn-helix domain-containing protein [Meiothermus granaticius]
MVTLANFADFDGYTYVGQARLAQATGQDERSVRSHLSSLEERGFIRRQARHRANGSRQTDGIWLLMSAHPAADAGSQPETVSGGGQGQPENISGGSGNSFRGVAEKFSSLEPSVLTQAINQSGVLSTHHVISAKSETPTPPEPKDLTTYQDPLQERKAAFREAVALEANLYAEVGPALTAKLKEIQQVSRRYGKGWQGWLREHVRPRLEAMPSQNRRAALEAAVKAFYAASNPERYGLTDFVKALDAFSSQPQPQSGSNIAPRASFEEIIGDILAATKEAS